MITVNLETIVDTGWHGRGCTTSYLEERRQLAVEFFELILEGYPSLWQNYYYVLYTAVNTIRCPSVYLMLAHLVRRWPNIKRTLGDRTVFCGSVRKTASPVTTIWTSSSLSHDFVGKCSYMLDPESDTSLLLRDVFLFFWGGEGRGYG